MAKVTLVLGWISSFGNAERRFSPTEHYASNNSSSTPAATGAPITESSSTAVPDNSPVPAQDWDYVDDWSIDYDYSDAGNGIPNGCFMARSYDDGFLRVGYYEPKRDYIIILANHGWKTSLEEHRRYIINVQLGNESPWTVVSVAEVLPVSKIRVLAFLTNEPRFFSELISNDLLTVSQSGITLLQRSVTGAKEALRAMLTCQEAHNGHPPSNS